MRLWTRSAGDKIWLAYGSLGRRSWRTVAVFVAFSWLGLLFSCILHVSVWISEVFFICCLGSRQPCCSFFSITAPGLALFPHFPTDVPPNSPSRLSFLFLLVDTSSSYMAGSLLVMGAGRQDIHWVVPAIGTYFHGCMPVGFCPGYIHGGLRFAYCSGSL